jgi:hypothetical protein
MTDYFLDQNSTIGFVFHVDSRNNSGRIWGSHGGEYEDGCLLGCSAV